MSRTTGVPPAAVPPAVPGAREEAQPAYPLTTVPPGSGSAPGSAATSAGATRRVQQNALRRLLADGGPRIVYQPQLSLSRLIVDGYEALARFPEGPMRGAEQWFAQARELGLGDQLEA